MTVWQTAQQNVNADWSPSIYDPGSQFDSPPKCIGSPAPLHTLHRGRGDPPYPASTSLLANTSQYKLLVANTSYTRNEFKLIQWANTMS